MYVRDIESTKKATTTMAATMVINNVDILKH